VHTLLSSRTNPASSSLHDEEEEEEPAQRSLGGGGGGEAGMTIMRTKMAQDGSTIAARRRADSIPRRLLLQNLRALFVPWLLPA
jgi:hypothetical protein